MQHPNEQVVPQLQLLPQRGWTVNVQYPQADMLYPGPSKSSRSSSGNVSDYYTDEGSRDSLNAMYVAQSGSTFNQSYDMQGDLAHSYMLSQQGQQMMKQQQWQASYNPQLQQGEQLMHKWINQQAVDQELLSCDTQGQQNIYKQPPVQPLQQLFDVEHLDQYQEPYWTSNGQNLHQLQPTGERTQSPQSLQLMMLDGYKGYEPLNKVQAPQEQQLQQQKIEQAKQGLSQVQQLGLQYLEEGTSWTPLQHQQLYNPLDKEYMADIAGQQLYIDQTQAAMQSQQLSNVAMLSQPKLYEKQFAQQQTKPQLLHEKMDTLQPHDQFQLFYDIEQRAAQEQRLVRQQMQQILYGKQQQHIGMQQKPYDADSSMITSYPYLEQAAYDKQITVSAAVSTAAMAVVEVPSQQPVMKNVTRKKKGKKEQPPVEEKITPWNSIGKTRTRETYRIVYTELQKLILEEEFTKNLFLNIHLKEEIALKTNLSERQVKIWFQNRRAKDRRDRRKNKKRVSKESDDEGFYEGSFEEVNKIGNRMQGLQIISKGKKGGVKGKRQSKKRV